MMNKVCFYYILTGADPTSIPIFISGKVIDRWSVEAVLSVKLTTRTGDSAKAPCTRVYQETVYRLTNTLLCLLTISNDSEKIRFNIAEIGRVNYIVYNT